MNMQAGQHALIRVKVETAGRKVVTAGTVVAEFWRPGTDPEKDPEVRAHPDRTAECEYDSGMRSWVAQVSTEGWEPGTWTVLGRVSGVTERGNARGMAWGTLRLAA